MDAEIACHQGGRTGDSGEYFRPWNRGPVKKNHIKPWLHKQWCIATPSGEYVQRMEDVLEVYKRLYDEKQPVVCIDETNRQLIGETLSPRPVQPGQAALSDYEME